MKALLLVRIGFYAIEAIVLASIIMFALILIRHSGFRLGRRLKRPSARAFAFVTVGLFLFDAICSERFGPRAILQYYLVMSLLVVSMLAVALNFVQSRVRQRPPAVD
jgi:uncharacterized membrane protein